MLGAGDQAPCRHFCTSSAAPTNTGSTTHKVLKLRWTSRPWMQYDGVYGTQRNSIKHLQLRVHLRTRCQCQPTVSECNTKLLWWLLSVVSPWQPAQHCNVTLATAVVNEGGQTTGENKWMKLKMKHEMLLLLYCIWFYFHFIFVFWFNSNDLQRRGHSSSDSMERAHLKSNSWLRLPQTSSNLDVFTSF